MLFSIALAVMTVSKTPEPFYIGTYTSPNGSKGIYRSTLDPETGTISRPVLAAEAPSPSYVAVHPKGKYLYAVLEGTGGTVNAYSIAADGSLSLLNQQDTQGGGPCHVSVSPKGAAVLTAAYGGGSVASLPIKADGSLGARASFIQNQGTGPNKGRQEGPHGHFIQVDPQEKFAYSCDLGTDEVLVYRFEAKTGKITPASPKSVKTHPGAGPRHLAIHPSGKAVFVNNELTNSVSSYHRDPSTGALTLFRTLSTLPDGVKEGSTAAIALHPNGKRLYVSNRGHDSIACYSVTADGAMELVEIQTTGVHIPRGMAIDPSGKWLVVGGQESNDIKSLKIDQSSGELTPSGMSAKMDKPVCIAFTAR